ASPGGTDFSRWLALLGVLLWVLPAVLVALSPKYQHELTLGVGHITGYVQYYGGGLLLAQGISWLAVNYLRTRGAAGLIGVAGVSLGLAILCTLTYDANLQVARYRSRPWFYDRVGLEVALDAGLAESVPVQATLILENSQEWLGRYGDS